MKSPRLLCALSLVAAVAAPAMGQDLYLANARIVDPASATARKGNLLILEGRVAGLRKRPPPGFAGEVLDLRGKWIIPGLVDLHTHSFGNTAPGGVFEPVGTVVVSRRMLYAGVTAFLDLFGAEAALESVRRRQRAGEIGGADVFASLSCLTAPKGHCTEYGVPTRTMDGPAQAREVVGDLARRRPDVVKIVYAPSGSMPSIDKATLVAAVAAAREQGLPTVIHVGTWQDVRDAVEAGATAVTHVPSAEAVPEDLPRAMVEHGVFHIPTLAVQTDLPYFVSDPGVLASPLARAVAPARVCDAYASANLEGGIRRWLERSLQSEPTVLASVKAISDAGVTLLAGTDSGNPGTLQGYSLHRELYKMVRAGLSPWEALAAATTDAGRFLGRSYGVSPRDEANLVVLDASPIADIRNTQRIHAVIHHGKLIDRQTLLAGSSPPSE